MTKIWMNWDTLTLKADGHAGGGPAGQNIICAGISAITQALLNYLLNEKEKGFVETEWRINPKSGSLRIRAKPFAGHTTATKACYRMAMIGLKAIEENYPGNIEIKEVGNSGIV